MRLTLDEMRERALELEAMLEPCRVCPRECLTHRRSGERGYCGASAEVVVSSAGPHFGEESVLVGPGGSGTIFFAHCNLRCVFCQNHDISQLGQGRPVSRKELAEIMLTLGARRCANINLVTPTHFAPQIVAALALARDRGLSLPVVYNCGGYESPDTLRLLEGVVDIYMPDAKYAASEVASALSQAPDYPAVLRAALIEMQRQVGDLEVGSDGLARRGLLIRHLVLPGDLASTEAVLSMLAADVSPRAAVNVMAQYHPCYRAVGETGPLGRVLHPDEYTVAVETARHLGLTVLND